MNITAEIGGKIYKFDASKEIDISIPVCFDKKKFKAFGAEDAYSRYYGDKDFTISVESGAGCNCPVFTFSAHLHGTHTECVGHISKQKYIMQDVCNFSPFIIAHVISLTPENAKDCGENYMPDFEDGDMVITRKMLQQKIAGKTDTLIIRTLPNDNEKLTRDYDDNPPAFFTNEAMQYICELDVQHLLVDMPSVDRLQDEGKLSNHHIYWNVEQGTNDVQEPSSKSITEFIYVPENVKDDTYILTINTGNIRSDAAPSRPVIYEVLS